MSDFLRRHSDSIWECYLCGDKFESEASKDSHMTQCMATDAMERNSDDSIHVANRRVQIEVTLIYSQLPLGFTSDYITSLPPH